MDHHVQGGISTAIVKSYNKITKITYVYESHKVWSKSEKKYKTVRRIIGKIDPISGQIVPTGPRGRPRREPREPISDTTTTNKTASSSLAAAATSDVQTLNATIAELKIENSLLISEREKVTGLLDSIMHFAEEARELLDQSGSKPNN